MVILQKVYSLWYASSYILGLVEYSIYTFPVGNIIRRHHIQYHMYADDTQLYVAFDLSSKNLLLMPLKNLKFPYVKLANGCLLTGLNSMKKTDV